MPQRAHPLTDLERKACRHMLAVHENEHPGVPADLRYINRMARAAVEALTTGSASGRRLRVRERPEPDPGCTPEKIRRLAERIEDSYAVMPQGWVRQRDIDEERLYG